MSGALTLVIRQDGSAYTAPPFYERIEVDHDLWIELFDATTVLDLEAQNGDPVRYELVDADCEPMVFRRTVGLVP